jgi:hypothetical protein
MSTKTLAIATVVAVTAAFVLATALVNIAPTYAKITEQTTCDGEVDEDGCPGKSAGPNGKGHDEDTENVNPQGTAPPGQNKED